MKDTLLILFSGLLLCGCSKKPTNVSAEIETGYSNFIPIVSNRVSSSYGPSVANGTAKTLPSVETNELMIATNTAMMEMGAAGGFMKELKMRGDLPGVSKNSHGQLSVSLHTDSLHVSQAAVAHYPFSLTFNLVLAGDSLTNHYLVMRPSPSAAWQLKRAWRTDLDGRVIKEWSVK